MLRLRTTTGLSLLALVIGVGGTAWLSGLTDQWAGPPARVRPHVDPVRTVLRRHPRPMHTAIATAHHAHLPPPASTVAYPSLTPVEMPPLSASLWKREPLGNGRVLLHLAVDGAGHVTAASVAQSSGDAGLDDRAVRTVQRWRFAVPADHPDGLEGELAMRFDDSSNPVARTP